MSQALKRFRDLDVVQQTVVLRGRIKSAMHFHQATGMHDLDSGHRHFFTCQLGIFFGRLHRRRGKLDVVRLSEAAAKYAQELE